MTEALQLRYPRAFAVGDSGVWECIDPERSEHWLRLRLHSHFRQGIGEADSADLIVTLSRTGVEGDIDELEALGLLLCALRLARLFKKQDTAVLLAMCLARRLLLLSGCPLRVAAAAEVWLQCDRVAKGLKHDNLFLRFSDITWDWFAQHALSVRCACLRMAFRNPYAGELAPDVMPAMLSELADGIASLDLDETVKAVSGFTLMTPHKRDIPDAEKVGMWRQFPKAD